MIEKASGGQRRRPVRYAVCSVVGHRWEPFEERRVATGFVSVMSGVECSRCAAWHARLVAVEGDE